MEPAARTASRRFVACSVAAGLGAAVAAGCADDGGATPDPFAAVRCEPVAAQAPGATCLRGATGSVSDLDDLPLGAVLVTVCGSQCFAAQSDAHGYFAVKVGAYLDTGFYAVHADGRPDHAVDYRRLATGEPEVVAVDLRLPKLPPSTTLLPPDDGPATELQVGDVTLSVAAGTTFDLNIADYANGDAGRTLRVATVALEDAPAYAREAGAAAAYALAPSAAATNVPLGVRVPNTAGLAAGAAVEFMVLGDDYFSLPPNVGLLQVAAQGHVSVDGATIATDAGEGIGKLTWLVVRLKGK